MSKVLYKKFISSVSTSGYKSGKFIPVHAIRAYRGLPHSFVTSAIDRGEQSDSHPGHFCTQKETPVPTEYETSQITQCLMTHFRMKQAWHN